MQPSSDKFGYYQVGDYRTYSKIDAIAKHQKTNIHPQWVFNDAVFSCYNWAVEPTLTLAELYKRRAIQIREKYDYVVLWYSSGADSDNVLRSFLDNDIKVDEVACFVNYSQVHDKNSQVMNGEIFNIAMPKLARYKDKYPDLKIRMIDICEHSVKLFESLSDVTEWHYGMNAVFNPNSTARSRLFKSVNEWAHLRDSGKRVCYVWGIDKPRVNLESTTNRYYLTFVDIVDHAVNPEWQSTQQNEEFMELFYWSPDLPELLIKQAHTIKTFLRNATGPHPFLTSKSNDLGYSIVNHEKLYLTNMGLNSLIYPKYEPNLLNEFKPGSLVYSPRDSWFFKLGENINAYNNWQQSLSLLWASIPEYWQNQPGDVSKALKGCVSIRYYLE